MYNILNKLLSEVKNSDFFDKIQKIAEYSEGTIKVKVNRQEIKNLMNPKDGVYETSIKEKTLDLEKY